jgi:hypothetical protein
VLYNLPESTIVFNRHTYLTFYLEFTSEDKALLRAQTHHYKIGLEEKYPILKHKLKFNTIGISRFLLKEVVYTGSSSSDTCIKDENLKGNIIETEDLVFKFKTKRWFSVGCYLLEGVEPI